MAHSAINELGEQHERKADEQTEQHASAPVMVTGAAAAVAATAAAITMR